MVNGIRPRRTGDRGWSDTFYAHRNANDLALHDSLIDLLVRRSDDAATAAAMVDWALEALYSGLDTPSLTAIASLPPTTPFHEVEMPFKKALHELGVRLPDEAGLRWAHVGVVSRALVAGRLPYDVALNRIHAHAVGSLGHPHDLREWCYVWKRNDPKDFGDLDEREAESEARRLAARWATHVPFGPGADGGA